MSRGETLFVGVARKTGPYARASTFERFKDELRAIPAETVAGSLQSRNNQALQAVAYAFEPGTAANKERRADAVLQVMLVGLARGIINNSESDARPFATPRWLSDIRPELDTFIDEEPESRAGLRGTVLYSDEYAAKRNVLRLLYASIYPDGPYDRSAFAAGVATGAITASLAHLCIE
jgi:hypothetical protein